MKKYFLTLSVLFATLPMWAQAPYACVTKGAVLEYASYNEEDKLESYSRQVIQEVTDLGDGNYDFAPPTAQSASPARRAMVRTPLSLSAKSATVQPRLPFRA